MRVFAMLDILDLSSDSETLLRLCRKSAILLSLMLKSFFLYVDDVLHLV